MVGVRDGWVKGWWGMGLGVRSKGWLGSSIGRGPRGGRMGVQGVGLSRFIR